MGLSALLAISCASSPPPTDSTLPVARCMAAAATLGFEPVAIVMVSSEQPPDDATADLQCSVALADGSIVDIDAPSGSDPVLISVEQNVVRTDAP